MKMKTIKIDELKNMENMGIDTMSVKDNSIRGITTKYIGDVKLGDKVVLDNHFVVVVE